MSLIVGFVCFFMFLGMGISLLCGKAQFLIAGFNTASPEEKANYDAKKLSIITGTYLLSISTVLLNLVLGLHYLPQFKTIYITVFISITLGGALLIILLANTWCRKR